MAGRTALPRQGRGDPPSSRPFLALGSLGRALSAINALQPFYGAVLLSFPRADIKWLLFFSSYRF